MNKRNQAEHDGGRTSIRSPLQLLLLSLFLCFLPYPGATASTSPTSATLRRSPTSTTTTTSTSGNKTKTSNTNTLNTQALNISTSTSTFNPSALQATRPSVTTSTSGNKTKTRNTNTLNSQALNTSTSTFNPSALQATRPSVSTNTSGIMAENTDSNTLSTRALHISTVSISGIQKGPTSTTSTIISRGRTRTRIRRATTKRQICPPPEEDVGSQGGPRAGRRKVASGSPVPAMKECAENQLGLVVEAGATEACRINVLDTYECDPRQAVMVLVTLDETLHSNGSVQAHQVGEGGAVEVYLKEEQPGSYRLHCVDNLTSESLVKVFVGFEVLDVEGFECRIQSVNELDCVWTLPYNPAQNDNDYRPYACVDQESKLCDCIDGSCGTEGDECMKECCSWDVRALPNMTDAAVSMVFWATNPLMNDYTYFRHSFDPLAVVVPEAPQEVEAAVSGLGVAVTWRTPAAFLAFPPCLTFLLDHRDAACPACAWTTDATGTCCAPECRSAARLEHWWRRYEVRVRLRSAAAPQPVEGDGWWSDWQPSYVNTSAAAPDAPPGVGPGTFQAEAAGFTGLSDLSLAWRTVPPLLHNGSDFGYLAQLCAAGDDDELRCEVLREVAVTESFAVFQNVSSSAPYTLRVSARNSAGGGPWAAAWVAAAAARPASPLLPVVVRHAGAGRQDGLYELRWAPGGEGNHTVYLCTGEHQSARPCTGQLYWASAGNASAVNLTLRDFGLQDASPAQVSFAVSAEDAAGASSGFSWDRCGAPQPYSSVRASPEPGDPVTSSSGVELPWTLSYCQWAGVVEGAEATCCRGAHASPNNCTDGRVSATGQPWAGAVNVAGLAAGEEYTAWLRLHYRGGASAWADGRTFKTPRRPVVWWVLVCSVLASVVVLVVSVALLRRLRRRLNATWKDYGRNINLPKGLYIETLDEKGEGKGGTGGEGSGGKEGEEGKEEPELELSITDSPFASDEEITSFRPSPRSLAAPKHYLEEHRTNIGFEAGSGGDRLDRIPSPTSPTPPSTPAVAYTSIQAPQPHPNSHLAEDTAPQRQHKAQEDATLAYTTVSDLSTFLADVPKLTQEEIREDKAPSINMTSDRSKEFSGHSGKGYVTLDHSLNYLPPEFTKIGIEEEVEVPVNALTTDRPTEFSGHSGKGYVTLDHSLNYLPSEFTKRGIEEVEGPSISMTDHSEHSGQTSEGYIPLDHSLSYLPLEPTKEERDQVEGPTTSTTDHSSKGYVTLDHSVTYLPPSPVPSSSEHGMVEVGKGEQDQEETRDAKPMTGYCRMNDGFTPTHLPAT